LLAPICETTPLKVACFVYRASEKRRSKMKSMIFVAAALLAAGPATAATMRLPQAMSSMGQNVVVEATAHVQEVAGGGANVELTDGSTAHLILNIPARVRTTLPDLATYEGKTVEARGVVEIGQQGPQITITRTSQLKLAAP
jgi:hypothetical protein